MELKDLIDNTSVKVRQELQENLKKALEEAQKTLLENYNSIINEYTRRLKDYISKEKERIEGERAKADVENKRILMLEREKWIEKVIDEVNKRLAEFLTSKDYERVLRSLLSNYVPKDSEVSILCNPRDTDSVKSIMKELGISAKLLSDSKIIGGIKIINEKENSAKDLTFNLILSQLFEEVKPKIFEILFGGE